VRGVKNKTRKGNWGEISPDCQQHRCSLSWLRHRSGPAASGSPLASRHRDSGIICRKIRPSRNTSNVNSETLSRGRCVLRRRRSASVHCLKRFGANFPGASGSECQQQVMLIKCEHSTVDSTCNVMNPPVLHFLARRKWEES
jgi:hypothetical protein